MYTYGRIGNRNGAEVLEVWEVSVRGMAYPSSRVVFLVSEWGMRAADLRVALKWNAGPVGVAETYYPHPRGWKLASLHHPNMERMTVRLLTAAFRERVTERPSCIARWQALVGPVDMRQVAGRLTSSLITPRDFKCYFRIIHRSMRTRNTVRGADLECRVCGKEPERFSHLSKCCVIRQVFARFHSCVSQYVPQVAMDDAFIYLGVLGTGKVLPGSLSALHVLTWRFVVI